ncbi:DUF2490 domain-containing protein [Longitalea arenae]|uniref:DUF2490 domain-containing protein n=1 Tax=Longitalea arenae TaxID=2812558 RepID=UPI001968920E|nr:DUF2490 domain-containing protein [Longitalea arenae]
MPSFLLFLFILLFSVKSISQHAEGSVIPWYFPGISYKANSKLEWWGQYGLNPEQNMHAAWLQVFIKTGKHLTLNPAYLYLNIDRFNEGHLHDHTLMNSAIIHFSINKLTIDDRNMIWNRFRRKEKDLHFYRNRLRFTRPLQTRFMLIKPYLFDEVSFSFNDGRFTRNRLAAGISCKLNGWFLFDISWLREQDRYNGATNLLFIMAVVQLAKS